MPVDPNNPNGEGNEPNTPPTLDEATKTYVNGIIEDRLNRQKVKFEQERDAALKTEREKHEAALKAEREKNKKTGEGETKETKDAAAEKEQYERLLKAEKDQTAAMRKLLEEKEKERDALRNTNQSILKNQAINEALSGQETFQFHNYNVVRKLTEDRVFFDEDLGTYVVKDENGVIQQNSSLQPMTLKEYYASYAAQNPFLVTSATKGGSGLSESGRTMAGGLKQVTSKADFKTVKDKVEYITKFGQEAFENLPLK